MKKTKRLAAKDLKAIDAYRKFHGYRLRLSILPNIAFRSKDGTEIEVNLQLIHYWMDNRGNNA